MDNYDQAKTARRALETIARTRHTFGQILANMDRQGLTVSMPTLRKFMRGERVASRTELKFIAYHNNLRGL